MADRWGIEATPAAPDQILGLVEAERARNPAIIEEAVAYTAMAGSETAGADVDTGDDVPERDVLESGNPGLKAELSEAPALEEHDTAGQRAAQACPDISLQVVTSADLRIYPAIDPSANETLTGYTACSRRSVRLRMQCPRCLLSPAAIASLGCSFNWSILSPRPY
jgi:hypothetical protein